MFKGKTAVITGGSRGIGYAIAMKMAQNNANIAIIYSGNKEKADSTVEEIKSLGVNAFSYQCDVSDFKLTKNIVSDILKDFGTIDILVNNAGITKDKLVLSMKQEDFESVVDTNLKGSFNMIKHCYPIFLKQKSGKIINISSVSGLIGNAGQANYSASKAGIIGLTKSVAKELASRGICCNAIAPGFIETDMTSNLSANNVLAENIPLKRFGKPEEVASLAVFLAGPCSDYITGEVICIDGGLAM